MPPRLNRPLITAFASIFLGLITGCGTEPACTEGAFPAIVVDIRDAFDGAPLAENARGAVQEGAFIDSLRPYGSFGNGVLATRAAAEERPGTYSVTVELDGYLLWQVDGVLVRPGTCSVETVELTANLQRNS